MPAPLRHDDLCRHRLVGTGRGEDDAPGRQVGAGSNFTYRGFVNEVPANKLSTATIT